MWESEQKYKKDREVIIRHGACIAQRIMNLEPR